MAARERISDEVLERQLDRLLTFFPRVDGKISALFAVTSAQVAVSALNLQAADLKLWWVASLVVVFGLCAAWVIVYLYRCAYPHLEGGQRSLIYFGEIAARREAEYIRDLCEADRDSYRKDVAGQVWRNGEILCLKYRFLKRATIGASVSMLPWGALLIATSIAHGRLPVLGG